MTESNAKPFSIAVSPATLRGLRAGALKALLIPSSHLRYRAALTPDSRVTVVSADPDQPHVMARVSVLQSMPALELSASERATFFTQNRTLRINVTRIVLADIRELETVHEV